MKRSSFTMKGHFLALLSGIAAITVFYSCKKEKKDFHPTPAYYISESEKLSIPATVDLPPNTGGYTRIATFYAEGVQKYKAQLKPGTSTFEWVLVAPNAALCDVTNKKVGTHGAGPFWELSANDSLFAQHFAPARTAPSPNAANIDWLLLMPKAGKTPTGVFSQVSFIQRIDTKGGKAPAVPPTSANDTVDIPYTAIYRFEKKNP